MQKIDVSCYELVLFDCDGVIFDSNALKTEAFRRTLETYPDDKVEDFIEYHKELAGVSRYVKLRHFLESILLKKFDETEYHRLLDEFSKKCTDLYKTARFTLGSRELIEQLAANKSLFVVSGSDEEELRTTFKDRNIAHHFRAIYGSPKSKTEIVELILSDYAYKPAVLHIGDGEADYRVARDLCLDFVFMKHYSEAPPSLEQNVMNDGYPVIETLENIHAGISS